MNASSRPRAWHNATRGPTGSAAGRFPIAIFRKLALWLAAACIAFTVLTYQILFGAVVTPLHSRVNFHRHHLDLSDVTVTAGGALRFKAYVDSGPDTGAAYIIAARLLDGAGHVAAQWDGATLATVPAASMRNAYAYAWASRFKPETIGFSGQTGARAVITLPPPATTDLDPSAAYQLELEAIDGAKWQSPARGPGS